MGKSSCSSVASSAAKRSNTSLTTSLGLASGLSTLLTQTIGLRPIFKALPTTNFVCGIGPSAASTSTIAPSTIDRIRSTSPPKSAWPGVSTMLMRVVPHTTEVALARMVMPRSRSRSLVSITRSATRWLSRNAPDCCRSRSTRVVLPWSTWAMMAMLRSFIGVLEERGERGGGGAVLMREDDGDATARDFALVPVELCGAIHERPMEGKGAGALAQRPKTGDKLRPVSAGFVLCVWAYALRNARLTVSGAASMTAR